MPSTYPSVFNLDTIRDGTSEIRSLYGRRRPIAGLRERYGIKQGKILGIEVGQSKAFVSSMRKLMGIRAQAVPNMAPHLP